MAIKIPTAGHIDDNGVQINETFEGTLTLNRVVGDVTPIGVAWEKPTVITKSWELSASCNYDPADTAQSRLLTSATTGDNTHSALSFYEDACGVFTGSAILTSAVITKSVGSVDKFNLTFVGTGAIAYSPPA